MVEHLYIRELNKIKRDGLPELFANITEQGFFKSPASTRFHGSFEGGLAKHSYEVYSMFDKLCKVYKLKVPHETKVISGFFHDLCKLNLYTPNKNKDGTLNKERPYKFNDDFPIGHGEKSLIMVQKHMELTDLESILIRWHMGDYDPAWRDYSTNVRKKYSSILAFQQADQSACFYSKV